MQDYGAIETPLFPKRSIFNRKQHYLSEYVIAMMASCFIMILILVFVSPHNAVPSILPAPISVNSSDISYKDTYTGSAFIVINALELPSSIDASPYMNGITSSSQTHTSLATIQEFVSRNPFALPLGVMEQTKTAALSASATFSTFIVTITVDSEMVIFLFIFLVIFLLSFVSCFFLIITLFF